MLGILNTRQISKEINTNTKNVILVAFFQKKKLGRRSLFYSVDPFWARSPETLVWDQGPKIWYEDTLGHQTKPLDQKLEKIGKLLVFTPGVCYMDVMLNVNKVRGTPNWDHN